MIIGHDSYSKVGSPAGDYARRIFTHALSIFLPKEMGLYLPAIADYLLASDPNRVKEFYGIPDNKFSPSKCDSFIGPSRMIEITRGVVGGSVIIHSSENGLVELVRAFYIPTGERSSHQLYAGEVFSFFIEGDDQKGGLISRIPMVSLISGPSYSRIDNEVEIASLDVKVRRGSPLEEVISVTASGIPLEEILRGRDFYRITPS